MGEGQSDNGFNLAKGSTSILKGVDANDIGSTGVLYSNRTGETGVLKGSIAPNVYNTEYNYEKSNTTKSESKVGKVLIVALISIFVIIAVVAALRYFGVF